MSTCGAKIRRVMSSRAPDRLIGWDGDGEPVIESGTTLDLWQTCSKRTGHSGEHGAGFRTRILSRLRKAVGRW